MSTLQQVRDGVRLQTDLDSDDLPDGTLDDFIREGFDRTFAVEQRWPFFEYTWSLTKALDATTITMPTSPEVAFIQRVRSSDNLNLMHVSQQLAEDNFTGTIQTATPEFFSVWGSTMNLWPTPTAAAATFSMRGFRKPTWTGQATDELDGDDRLHLSIRHYAVSLAYAQMEDAELEQVYMNRWGAHTDAVRRDLMKPQFHEALILNGGMWLPYRNRLNVLLDP